MKSAVCSIGAGALALVALVSVGQAQETSGTSGPAPLVYGPISVEPYYAIYSRKSDIGGGRDGVSGIGVRAMFRRGAVEREAQHFFDRVAVGGFFTYSWGQGSLDQSLYNFGGEADVYPWAQPVGNGWVDPFVSLGVGAFRASTAGERVGAPAGTTVSTTDFALTPGVGANVPITRTLRFRGDLGDNIVFGNTTHNNFLFEAGVAFNF